MTMEELLTTILQGIVKNPQDVQVTSEATDDTHVTLYIHAADADKGVIIGKGGRIIKALGDIINIKGFEEGKRAYLKLMSTEGEGTEATSEGNDEE